MGTTRQVRSSGEGSIYQRHDESRYGCPPAVEVTDDDGKVTTARPKHKCSAPFVGSLVIGWREGKPMRKKVSGTSKSDVAGKLRSLREKLDANQLPEGRPVTVEQWMNHWLANIAPRTKKKVTRDSTLGTYGTNVRQYINPLLGHHRLDRLTPELIDEAWDTLLNEGNPTKPADQRTPLSPNSVHLTHCVLRRALKLAVQRNRIKTNPAGSDAMDAPPKVDNEVEPIPRADVERILAVAAKEYGGARWSVALALGLRPAEAMGLRWEDVDFEAGTLRVAQQVRRSTGKGLVATDPKSRKGKRTMYLPASLLADLKAHKRDQLERRMLAGDQWTDTGLVFTLDDGRAIDTRLDGKRWHALLDRAGVTHRRLYDARHSAATMLLAQGVDMRTAMDLLGHSQISVTMKYQHAVDDLKAEAARRIEAGMWGSAAASS